MPLSGPAASPSVSSRLSTGLAASALAGVALLVYGNTFSAPFVFDDIAAITRNPSLAHFSTALSPPSGLSVTGRPLVNLSLAFNYAISGEGVWSYHALNLVLHILCGLILFALVRRTPSSLDAQLRSALAFAIAMLWMVHPVLTGAVTYVMQRSELLMSLCGLLTLYFFARAGLRESGSRPATWLGLSVVACLLGMASKEVMATVPLIVLLFDRTFVAGSFGAALRARPLYYLALAATCLLLGWLVVGTDSRGASAGFGSGVAWTDYSLRQIYAVALYVRLILCPFPLVFDYGSELHTNPSSLLLSAGVAGLLVIATIACLRRRGAIGFCGAAFLLLLAPTSSVVPIATQTVAEHRVYLASAAAIVLIVGGIFRWLGRRALPVCLLLAAALGPVTIARNADYRSPVLLWRDTVNRRPHNPRAHYNLAVSLLAAGDASAALGEFDATLRADETHALAHQKLGTLLLAAGRPDEALPHLEFTVRQAPESPAAHYELAGALVQLHRLPEAYAHYAESVRLNPTHAAAHYNLGNALVQLGRYEEALAHFDEAARLEPSDASARNNAARLREYLRK
jgi:tetratricopeptide (TPR) repeat protein